MAIFLIPMALFVKRSTFYSRFDEKFVKSCAIFKKSL